MKLKKDVAVSEAGLVFNPTTGESFSVNPIGVEILGLIREDKGIEEISRAITAKYSIDKATFERDFQDFTGVLSQYNLLVTDGKKKA
jgi:Coenzyme PQQ synthesis protein D (PqqD)